MPTRKTPADPPKTPPRRPRKPATTPAKPKPPARKRSRAPKAPPPVELSNVDRIRGDLETMGPEIASSGLAGAALTLARDLDNRKNSATSHAMCATALQKVMAELRELAPPKESSDGIDKVRAKGDRRISRLRAVK